MGKVRYISIATLWYGFLIALDIQELKDHNMFSTLAVGFLVGMWFTLVLYKLMEPKHGWD